MTTYRGIKGLGIQNITSDAVASQVLGGTWSSGNDVNTRHDNAGGAGTVPSGIVFGGDSPGAVDETETYDGTTWTERGDLNVSGTRRGFGASANSALAVGGSGAPPYPGVTSCEKWNGSSWTAVNAMNEKKEGLGACGIVTAGLAISGLKRGPPNTYPDKMESWDGTSWTETTEVNQGRSLPGTFGTQTAAIIAGGSPAPDSQLVESWNGSAWTETTEFNTDRPDGRMNGAGIQTSGMVWGGNPINANTETFDGTSWTEVANLGTARMDTCPSTNTPGSSAAFAASGIIATGSVLTTEEWSAPATFRQFNAGDIYYNADPSSGALKYVGYGTGAWASGGDMNVQGYQLFSLGTQTAAIQAGGYGGPPVGFQANAESYDGTSWTAMPAINDSRSNEAGAGSGTTAAGLIYGGHNPGFGDVTETWNGSSWSEVNELNTGRRGLGGCGTQTASLAFAGQKSPGSGGYTDEVELWNGTSWSETTEINASRAGICAIGQTSTALLGVAGFTNSDTVEEWDGSSWTEIAEINTGRDNAASRGGTSTDGIIAGGHLSTRLASTEEWNGTSWTEVADLATARYGIGGQGATSKAAIAFGGNTSASDPAGVVSTEEWTFSHSVKTVTTS